MNKIVLIFVGLLTVENFWMANGFSLNPPGGAAVSDPAPGRSPGPPDPPEVSEDAVSFEKVSDVVLSKCELHGTLKESDHDVDFNFTISHPLYSTEELVQGLVYEGRFLKCID